MKRFQDDAFVILIYGREQYLSDHYVSKKIQFTIEIRELKGLKFSDFKFSIDSNDKISIDFYVYFIKSFVYVLPSTSFIYDFLQ